MKQPKPFAVYVSGTSENGKPYFMRCGPAASIEDARALVQSEIRGCRETFGGMIEPARNKRRYHIFRATWQSVE